MTGGNETRMNNYSNEAANAEYCTKIREKKAVLKEEKRGRLMKKSCQDVCALKLIRDIV